MNASKKNIDVIKCALRIESAMCEHPDTLFLRMDKNQRLNPVREPTFYLLTSGKIRIYRKCDDVLVMEVTAPAVIDICRFVMGISHHYFRSQRPVTLFSLKQAQACLLFDEKALWRDILFLQCDLVEQHYQREEMASGGSHYDIVREHLLHIWSLPPGERDTTPIYPFILTRNKMSRSSIYNIIRNMTRDGVIRTRRGKLIFLIL